MSPELTAFEEELAARGLTAARRIAQLRVLQHFDGWLKGRGLLAAEADDLSRYLLARHASGYAATTLRKERQMLLSFYEWAYPRRLVSADALLGFRAVRSPG